MNGKITAIVILSLFILLNYVNAQEMLEDVFYFHLIIYKNDTVTLDKFEIIEGVPSDFPGISLSLNYSILLLSTENNVIFRGQLPISFTAYPMPPEGQPEVEVMLNESEQYLRLPYFENIDRMEIYHDNKLIFTYEICDVNNLCEDRKGETTLNCPDDCELKITCGNNKCETGETQENCCKDCGCQKGMECVNNKCVSEKCGNDKCDANENYNTCSKDCPSGLGDGYCDGVKDGLCDPDCQKNEDVDCNSSKLFIYIIIGIVIIGLIFLILIKSRRGE